jgi:hypothetical protein
MEPQKQKRIRKRSLAIQLEQALRDAEAAMGKDISTQKLAQTRVVTLNRMLAREEKYRLADLEAEVTRLATENQELKREAEVAAKPVQQVTEIDRVLVQYEAEKAGKTLDDDIAKKLQRIKNGGSDTETQPVASMPVGPLPEEIANQERERIADLEEKSRERELQRKRAALEYAERMAAADRENAELDEKLSKLGSKYYTPSTTSALL